MATPGSTSCFCLGAPISGLRWWGLLWGTGGPAPSPRSSPGGHRGTQCVPSATRPQAHRPSPAIPWLPEGRTLCFPLSHFLALGKLEPGATVSTSRGGGLCQPGPRTHWYEQGLPLGGVLTEKLEEFLCKDADLENEHKNKGMGEPRSAQLQHPVAYLWVRISEGPGWFSS